MKERRATARGYRGEGMIRLSTEWADATRGLQ
jgi:hypothetical protein